MPSLGRLYREFKDRGFVVLAVNVAEGKETVRRYVEKEDVPFPVLLDTQRKVADGYGIRSHPDHFLLNRRGEIIGWATGARDWASEEVRALIRFLLKNNEQDDTSRRQK